jgi:TPR repeat protein
MKLGILSNFAYLAVVTDMNYRITGIGSNVGVRTLVRLVSFAIAAGVHAETINDPGYEELVIAAEGGDADAQLAVGEALFFGQGTPRDIPRAVWQIVVASKSGSTEARTRLADFYMSGLVVPYDPRIGFRLYMESAVEKDNAARYEVANSYEFGRGVTPNSEKARIWFERIAAGNENPEVAIKPRAAKSIAFCFRDGTGTAPDPAQAQMWMKKAADGGDPDAIFQLGKLLEFGVGTKPDQKAANALYLKAADAGYARACLVLGQIYLFGRGLDADLDTARIWFKRAVRILREEAEQGSVQAATDLYIVHYESKVLEDQSAEGMKWLREAAEKKYPRALLLLGKALAEESGVEGSIKKGLAYIEEAATLHESDAHFLLWQMYRAGVGTPPDEKKAMAELNLAARYNNITAMHVLAEWYRTHPDVDAAEELAAQWYRKARDGYLALANRGNFDAMSALVVLYGQGRGVEKDQAEAYRWLHRAAEIGYDKAQFMLANAYENGLGVDRDEKKALSWYKRAAAVNFLPAMIALGAIYEQGVLGASKNLSTANSWYRKAFVETRSLAELDNADAQYLLSTYFARGIGTDRSTSESIHWLRKSGENGYLPALMMLGSIYSRGDSVPRDVEEALKWIREAAEQGEPRAQYLLGKAYYDSSALDTDYPESYKWLTLSTDLGFEPARMLRDELDVILDKEEAAEGRKRAKEFLKKETRWQPEELAPDETDFMPEGS